MLIVLKQGLVQQADVSNSNDPPIIVHALVICLAVCCGAADVSSWSSKSTLDDWRRAAALTGDGMLFNHPVLIVLSDYSVPYAATEMYYKPL